MLFSPLRVMGRLVNDAARTEVEKEMVMVEEEGKTRKKKFETEE